jgi:hypothetical protein
MSLKYLCKGIHGISIYPHSASNMSVNAVLSSMQCGYPKAAHVNFTRGGVIFEKIREKSYGLASAPFQRFCLVLGYHRRMQSFRPL